MLEGKLKKGQRVTILDEKGRQHGRVMCNTPAWDTFVWVSYDNQLLPIAGFGECMVFGRRSLALASELEGAA